MREGDFLWGWIWPPWWMTHPSFRAVKAGLAVVIFVLTMLTTLPISPITVHADGAAATLGTTTISSLNFGYQHSIFGDNKGVIFALVCTGSSWQYRTSSDRGITWSGATIISACSAAAYTGFWFDGAFVYVATIETIPGTCTANNLVCYRVGTIAGTTITFDAWQGISVGFDSTNAIGGAPTIATDTNGNIWITA